MSDIGFVRTEFLEPSPPPSNAVGPVKWVKDNLFSGPVNSALSVLAFLFVGLVLYEILPWLIDSAWAPAEMSLAGCRAEATGACFAVINERFYQFIFGFYPSELYWRPTLAFLLLLAALWPILFESAPRPLLWLSAVYPMLAYLLIWGGSIWGPLMVLAGPVVGYLIFSKGGSIIESVIG
ncbi:MAG: amino acid ABC transporter permease, partial [Pseudomonadota bacterium]